MEYLIAGSAPLHRPPPHQRGNRLPADHCHVAPAQQYTPPARTPRGHRAADRSKDAQGLTRWRSS